MFKWSDFSPAPGVALVKPYEASTNISLGETKPPSRSIKGTVIAIGADFTTAYNVLRKASDYGAVGDTIVFFTNDPDFDYLEIDGSKYYLVSFEDFRGRINGQ